MCVNEREDLCARSPFCFLDLDLQQEETVLGLFSGDLWNEGLQEIARRYKSVIKKGGLKKGALFKVYFRIALPKRI